MLRKRCLYLKKNKTDLEVITYLDSNKKYHCQRDQRFTQLSFLSYTVALSNFFWKDLTAVIARNIN